MNLLILAVVLLVFLIDNMAIFVGSTCTNCGQYGRCLEWQNSTNTTCLKCACPAGKQKNSKRTK